MFLKKEKSWWGRTGSILQSIFIFPFVFTETSLQLLMHFEGSVIFSFLKGSTHQSLLHKYVVKGFSRGCVSLWVRYMFLLCITCMLHIWNYMLHLSAALTRLAVALQESFSVSLNCHLSTRDEVWIKAWLRLALERSLLAFVLFGQSFLAEIIHMHYQ